MYSKGEMNEWNLVNKFWLCGTNPWSPARAFGGPADFRLAHAALDPVTAVFLLHDDLAGRAVHCITVANQLLKEKA